MEKSFFYFSIIFIIFSYSCSIAEDIKSENQKKSAESKIAPETKSAEPKDLAMNALKIKINPNCEKAYGAIVRGPKDEKKMSLVFTGGSWAESGELILNTLKENNIKGSFFFTGEFFRIPEFASLIKRIVSEGHYISIHSDAHLLYAPWEDRSKTLVTKEEFTKDVDLCFKELEKFGVKREDALFWIPPYEWYNDTIAKWSEEIGLILINNTSGTLSAADYTQDEDKNFRSNKVIYDSIINKEQKDGLNGYMLLTHIGVAPKRTEKFAVLLPELIKYLKEKNYSFHRVDELLTIK